MFNYHINLHYSQTKGEQIPEDFRFNYHINLHYSQTSNCSHRASYHYKYGQTHMAVLL